MRFSRSRESRRELGSINVTSLVDIIFNLLLFFMLTTSFSENTGLEIELPEAAAADVQVAPDDLTVALTKSGDIVVRGRSVSLDELKEIFRQHKAENRRSVVIVQADQEVPHGRVVEVVDTAKREGLPRLGIATQSSR
jgi:biopolymer transport protein ExbD